MVTLAIDTTGDSGSIALVHADRTLEERLIHAPQGFSHVLFAEIKGLLERQSMTLSDVGLYASASGPGSFTGVRVGLSVVKGFAEVHHRPVIAISNLRALASFGSAPLRATILDARRGEAYAAVYDAEGNVVVPEQVIAFSKFLEHLPEERVEWICSDFTPFQSALPPGSHLTNAPRSISAAIARLAQQRLLCGGSEKFVPEAIDANYVRRSDAELFWKEI